MFTVYWRRMALNRLAEIWARAADRGAITAAVDRIDRELSVAPAAKGESRDEGRRILLEPPLGVFFRVEPQDRAVSVLTVWYIAAHRP